MKLSRLLVLSALALFGFNAYAADLIERTAPEEPASAVIDASALAAIDKTPVTFNVGDCYVLFNKGAQQYFTEGNAWGTQASITNIDADGNVTGTGPLLVRFTLPEGKTLEDAALLLNDYAVSKGSWKLTFFDNPNGMFVDRGSQANYFWNVVPVEGTTYRLQCSAANPDYNPTAYPDQFVGVAADAAAGVALAPFLAEGWIDWEFYAVPEWTAYFVAKDAFDASVNLKAVIEKAEEMGVDVSAAVAVYNNEASTVADIQAAIAAQKKLMTDKYASATAENPADMTEILANPNFDGASSAGWSGTAPNMVGSGSHGPANAAEHYNKTFDTYQDLTSMPAGVYVYEATAFYRGQLDDYKNHTNYNAFIYAKMGNDSAKHEVPNPWEAMNTTPLGGKTSFGTTAAESTGEIDGVTYYIPNDPSAGVVYFEKGFYKTRAFFDTESSEIRIGIKKNVAVSNDWTVFDNFKLTYYGKDKAAAYGAIINNYKAEYIAIERAEAAEPFHGTVGKNYTDQYYDAVKNFAVSATTAAEVEAAIEALKEVAAPLNENIALWSQYLALAKEASFIPVSASEGKLDASDADVQAISDWVDLDGADEWNDHALTNEELKARIAELVEIFARAKVAYPKAGDIEIEMTDLLTNPTFTNNANGWTREAASGGNVAWGSNCYEAWNNANFDVYQIYKNAPEGIYRIECQGFYRYLRGDNAFNAYKDQTSDFVKEGGAPVFVYMNAKATPFKNVFDEAQIKDFYSTQVYSIATQIEGKDTTLYFPDGMISSNEAFTEGMYKQSAYGAIKAGQDMRFGVKGASNQGGDSWVIWDNFKLFNCGKQGKAVKEVLPDEINNAEAMLKDEQGNDQMMGKTIHANLVAAIEAAKATVQAGIADTDTTAFDKLIDLFDAEENVRASVELFKRLIAANTALSEAVGQYGDESPVGTEAAALKEDVDTKLSDFILEDADVEALIKQIEEMTAKLMVPPYADASDMNGIDFTRVIKNNDYTEGLEGWAGTEATRNAEAENAEIFGKNYDYYQDIVALPAGTYEVKVQAFYRAGSTVKDYNTKDSLEYSHGFLYAMNGDSIISSSPLARLAEGAEAGNTEVAEGYAAAHTDTVSVDPEDAANNVYDYTVVANNMKTAGDEFVNGKYKNNSVIVKVLADGKLRIGLKKTTEIADNWTIFDNWELWYYGEASSREANGDPSGISEVNAAPVIVAEYFTLDGRKVNRLQNGIIIKKMTMKDGSVVVKKIRK